MGYSIIIPIYNEEKTIDTLLPQLKKLYFGENQIIIINDGSTDRTLEILKKYPFIKLITFTKNQGKGSAIREGLLRSQYDKIVIYDGDLELDTHEIYKLMKLNKSQGIHTLFGTRFNNLSPFKSKIDWGNFIFTTFFNIRFNCCHKDILCCAKSFYRSDLPIKKIRSTGFDIDVELSFFLTKINLGKNIKQVLLNYKRRGFNDGKKLHISDGWIILKRILLCI